MLAGAVLLSGCGSDRSITDTQNRSAEQVADVGWVMIIAASVVTIGVVALLAYGLLRHRGGRPGPDWHENRWILGGGVLLPIAVVLPIAGISLGILDDDDSGTMEVEVIAHQFWWEYVYPEHGFETANELHIPVGEPVRLVLHSDDVIHSLWVPELGGKSDLVPGRTNSMVLEADEPGVYRGQCAEYCGVQHAKMLLLVVAQERPDFDRWVDEQRSDAGAPTGELAATGHDLFSSQGCASCHTVRGTEAEGVLGPDLTHVAGRRTIGAGVLPTTTEAFTRWVGETWEVKEGIFMPPVPLTADQVRAIVAYLEELE